MRKFILVIALLLAGCGGSVAPIPRTTPLYTGFYGSLNNQVAETAAFTNFYWESFFQGEQTGIANILAAQKPTVLDVSPYLYTGGPGAWVLSPNAASNLTGLFTRMQAAGALQYVTWLYPMDEPDINLSLNDQTIGNQIARQVASTFPQLANIKLAVIFSGVTRLTNIGQYDLVGFDDYNAGSAIFDETILPLPAPSEYDQLVNAMSAGQQIILVPGGANPWQTPPWEFYSTAAEDGRIAMIAAFVWFDYNGTGSGIRDNGMANAYCTAAQTAMNVPINCSNED